MDGLVNNAALAICKPFLEVPPEDFDLYDSEIDDISEIFLMYLDYSMPM